MRVLFSHETCLITDMADGAGLPFRKVRKATPVSETSFFSAVPVSFHFHDFMGTKHANSPFRRPAFLRGLGNIFASPDRSCVFA